MSNLKLAFILEAIDKATAPLRKVGQAVDRINEPARRVSRSMDQVALRFGRMMGFRLQRQWGDISDRGRALSASAQNVAQTLGAVTIAAGGAFYAMKRTADEIDRANDTAKKLGMTLPVFQRMGYAAQLNGSSSEEMGQALQFISQNMVEAINGSKEATQWFARVGIPLKQLKTMNAGSVFEAIADKFHAVGDAGQNAEKKIAVLKALTGRSGPELKQMLDLGSAGLKKFYEEADRVGAVVSGETGEAMADFNDNFDRLKFSIFGVMASITKAALPALDDLIQRFTELNISNRAEWGERIGAMVSNIVVALPGFLKSLGQIAGALVMIAGAADVVAQAMGGWQNVIYLVSFLVGVKLAIGLYTLGWALAAIIPTIWSLGAALMATPLGWFMAAIALIAGAIFLIYRNWEPVKAFFVGLWEGVKAAFLSVYNFIAGKLGAILAFAGKVIDKVNSAFPSGGQLDTGGYDSMGNTTGYGAAPAEAQPSGYGAAPAEAQPSGYGAAPAEAQPSGYANAPGPKAQPQPQPARRGAFNLPSALPAGSAAKADVGGTLNIKIDQEGRARVAEVKSNNKGVDYAVYTGMSMAGA